MEPEATVAPPVTTTTTPTAVTIDARIASASIGDRSANVQIAFFAEKATAPVGVEVTNVVLVDATSGATVATLTASAGGVWNGRAYEPWNQQVTPGGDLRASYPLSSPPWSTIDGTGTGRRGSSYSTSYKVRVTLRMGDREVTLESGQIQREPEAVT